MNSIRMLWPLDGWTILIIRWMGDDERIRILQEWAGYLLFPTNYLQRFIVFEGEGGNGKTVCNAAMEAMLGRNNVSHVSIEQFGDRFALASTLGKAANISAMPARSTG